MGGEVYFDERGNRATESVPKFLKEYEVKLVRSRGFMGFKGADCSINFLCCNVVELWVIYSEKGI